MESQWAGVCMPRCRPAQGSRREPTARLRSGVQNVGEKGGQKEVVLDSQLRQQIVNSLSPRSEVPPIRLVERCVLESTAEVAPRSFGILEPGLYSILIPGLRSPLHMVLRVVEAGGTDVVPPPLPGWNLRSITAFRQGIENRTARWGPVTV